MHHYIHASLITKEIHMKTVKSHFLSYQKGKKSLIINSVSQDNREIGTLTHCLVGV